MLLEVIITSTPKNYIKGFMVPSYLGICRTNTENLDFHIISRKSLNYGQSVAIVPVASIEIKDIENDSQQIYIGVDTTNIHQISNEEVMDFVYKVRFFEDSMSPVVKFYPTVPTENLLIPKVFSG